MIGVLVKLNIKEGSEKDFEENMLKLVEATNANAVSYTHLRAHET